MVTKFRVVTIKIPKRYIKAWNGNPTKTKYYEIKKGKSSYAWFNSKPQATKRVNLLNK